MSGEIRRGQLVVSRIELTEILVEGSEQRLVLDDDQLRWLLTTAIPAVLPATPSPAEALAQMLGRRDDTRNTPPPAAERASGRPAVAADRGASPPAGRDLEPPDLFTVLPGTDEDDAPPGDGGEPGGASKTVVDQPAQAR